MGIQIIRFIFLPRDSNLQTDFKNKTIIQIRQEFVERFKLIEEYDENFLIKAREPTTTSDTMNFFSWIHVFHNEKDGFIELNAHIKDGTIFDFPNDSKIFYRNDKNLHLNPISIDDIFKPILIQINYDINNIEHENLFRDLELLIKLLNKIKNYVSIGREEYNKINNFSLSFFNRRRISANDNLIIFQNQLEYLGELLEKINRSVHLLSSIGNQISLNMENTRKLQGNILQISNSPINIDKLEKWATEIEYKLNDARIFYQLLEDEKDLIFCQINVKGNQQLIQLNTDIKNFQDNAATFQNAAKLISFIVLFQVIVQ